ncbi:hypothetical protein RDV64_22895 (plasmid) [Acuticoccus sp. MNP-M23]|uniref:hypothetical protein n=1 Tax=Acuticoccus sp. MNP-M23 TaxID=3072793 RepID=UPI0028150D18|nr:hypothetical protein [Acuticoccus sp. MNP-M23]WMS45174.1 hypothetical protein RDV64_22895 [Acuticoccus sp. MNP-M23]
MKKLASLIRAIKKTLVARAKLSISIALNFGGFLRVEVRYARDLGKPPEEDA